VVETASLGNGSTGGGGGIGDAAGGGDAGGGSGGIPSGLPFQVGYREAGQEYTLYLLATREQDRAEWIRAIRAGKLPFFAFFFPFSFLCMYMQFQSGFRMNVASRDRLFQLGDKQGVVLAFSAMIVFFFIDWI